MFFDVLKTEREKPIELIFGTDWWTDCDDVAALHILLKAHNRGLVNLKAIGVSSVMRYSAPSVKAVCEAQGLGSIPIGLDTNAVRKGLLCLYQKKLAAYCKTGFTNADCPEAYKLYRAALASSAEKAVMSRFTVASCSAMRIISSLIRMSPGPTPVMGEIAPCST